MLDKIAAQAWAKSTEPKSRWILSGGQLWPPRVVKIAGRESAEVDINLIDRLSKNSENAAQHWPNQVELRRAWPKFARAWQPKRTRSLMQSEEAATKFLAQSDSSTSD